MSDGRPAGAPAGLLVGTCGWQYRDWRDVVYPPGCPQREWLGHYASRFGTVEVDSTFYRLPSRDSVVRWAAAVPDDFRFAVKMSRYLTHIRRLADPGEPVGRFLDRMEPLGPRWGPTLVQLPPDLRRDDGRLRALLERWPADRALAVEFRHPSWFCDAVFDHLHRARAALVLTDRRGRPLEPLVATTDWGYVRLHEGAASPWPGYGAAALGHWVRRVVDLWGAAPRAGVYFNNDPGGAAPRDAERFRVLARRAGIPA